MMGASTRSEPISKLLRQSKPMPSPSKPSSLRVRLGIDFGTRFIKVCWNYGRQVEVVPFTDDQSTLKNALLCSEVALTTEGALWAGLNEPEWRSHKCSGAEVFRYLKMELAESAPHPKNGQETAVNAKCAKDARLLSAWLLSQVIRRAKAWISKYRSEHTKNRALDWTVCVGIPVEYSDSPARAVFEEVLSLAVKLAEHHSLRDTPAPPKVPWSSLQGLRRLAQELEREPLPERHQIEVFEELAAAVQSFTQSREAKDGHYLFFDVGGGTVDGISFKFERQGPDDAPTLHLYGGRVERLGVRFLAEALKAPSGPSVDTLEKWLVDKENTSSVCTNEAQKKVLAQKEEDLKRQVSSLTHTLQNKDPLHYRPAEVGHLPDEDRRRRASQPLSCPEVWLLIGGGGHLSWFYRSSFKHAHVSPQDKPLYTPKMDPSRPFPQDFSMNGLKQIDFHRFAVAYGLALAAEKRTDVRLPTQAPKGAAPEPSHRAQGPFISKDQI